jgi:hypothetical protein
MACVASCPVENALQLALPPRKAADSTDRWRARVIRPRATVAILAVLFFGMILFARMSGHWQTHVPQHVYMLLVPNANAVSHPM